MLLRKWYNALRFSSSMQVHMQRFFASVSLLAFLILPGAALAADCPTGFESKAGQCEIKRACPTGQTMRDGKCQSAAACPAGQTYMDGLCVTKPAGATTVNPVFNTK